MGSTRDRSLKVLILEDEPFIALDLETIVEETVTAVVSIRSSVREAEKVLDQPFDVAFLDIHVTNGETFEVARHLKDKRVPFIFVSAYGADHIPAEWRDAPRITKPYTSSEIKKALVKATGG